MNVAYVCPLLTSYVLRELRGLVEDDSSIQLHVVYGPSPKGQGFGDHGPFEHPRIRWLQVREARPLGNNVGMFQKALLQYVISNRPDKILLWANPRYLSFWATAAIGKLLRIPVLARGHGLFKYPNPSLSRRLLYGALLRLVDRYICYTPSVRNSLLNLTNRPEKLLVDFNTLTNDFPVAPEEKSGSEKGIFYLGRIRGSCGVDVLVDAVSELNAAGGMELELYIVGAGPLSDWVKAKVEEYPWLYYYGAVYDHEKISLISRHCRIGCVPGFMGLNTVHKMSLSLPVVTHGLLDRHMGPEPEYLRHGYNSYLLPDVNNRETLKDGLVKIWNLEQNEVKIYMKNAYETYVRLNDPPLHRRWLNFLHME